jgi:DNA-directed RNA polymerase subunit K/omega
MKFNYQDFIRRLVDFDGNHYELSYIAFLRAKHLVNNNLLASSEEKAAVRALYEVLTGKVQVVTGEEKEEI